MKKCALYKHFDQDQNLIYVGISSNPFSRHQQHSHNSLWFEKVKRIDLEWFDSKEHALIEETKQISLHRPPFNRFVRGEKRPRKKSTEAKVFLEKPHVQEEVNVFIRQQENNHMKLAVWVAGTGKRKSEAAKMLGLHPATLSQFLSGKQKPGPKAKLLIEANTNNEVAAKDWE